jgi:hypothetical protein
MMHSQAGRAFARVAAAVFAAGTLGAASLRVPAFAHFWYPIECCSEFDCRKVDRIEYLDGGGMIMHAGPVTVTIPKGFAQRPSADSDAHVCAFRNVTGGYTPRCVFMPAGAWAAPSPSA